jgi:hypothetical protein
MQRKHVWALDKRTLSAWREEANEFRSAPLGRQFVIRERELFRRFAEHYHKLRALPRKARRSLQRESKQSLGRIAFLLTLANSPALGATINVDDLCSLADAITAANTNTTVGGCAAGVNGPDTIVLPANSKQTLTSVLDVIYGPTGLPVISSEIFIEGNGSTISRSATLATPEFRIFAVDATGNLNLRDTTVSGGIIKVEDVTGFGGALFVSDGTASLINSRITGNVANRGGGVYVTDVNPGDGAYGVLNLTDTTISGNTALAGGGIAGNGVVVASNTTISNNTARDGGGVLSSTGGPYEAGRFEFNNCTISGNSATESGGGLANALRAFSVLNKTTIARNSGKSGGGISNFSKASVVLNQTLISGNKAPESREVYNFTGSSYDAPGVISADSFNVFGYEGSAGVTGFNTGVTDIVPSVPLAAIIDRRLRDNGGPTATHALPKGSPAIDAVPAANCVVQDKDQRGYSRPVDADFNQVADCDAGAVERIPEISSCEGRQLTRGCTVNGVPNQLCLGTSGRDTIEGTSGADIITGTFGNDVINGNGGDDMICGGRGNDILHGGDGNDRLFGQEEQDILRGNDGNDALNGGADADVCRGNGGADAAVSCEVVSNAP